MVHDHFIAWTKSVRCVEAFTQIDDYNTQSKQSNGRAVLSLYYHCVA